MAPKEAGQVQSVTLQEWASGDRQKDLKGLALVPSPGSTNETHRAKVNVVERRLRPFGHLLESNQAS